VDLIVVNGVSVDWFYHLSDGDTVSVYPVFETLDISPVVLLRPEPLRVTRFILDVHLGRLARWLRMLGFDTEYDPESDDTTIIDRAAAQSRIILTRDRGLLKNSRVTHGYWVRATAPREQIEEIVDRLDLRTQFRPFSRCMECNGAIAVRRREQVADRVPPRALERAREFRECSECGKVYWDGTHLERMQRLVAELS
jgi:uncharacterized protein with PIN domain